MAKPVGPACNLDCSYCYYVRKSGLGGSTSAPARMSDAQLETYIRGYIAASPDPTVTFAWQGGEPTLLGVDWFRRMVELQQRLCPPGRRIDNALQTNGTKLDDAWGTFLKEHQFLVGISLDGPAELHDPYRINKGGGPSHAAAMNGIAVLRKYGVEFNTLTTVNRLNQDHGKAVYNFLVKEAGSRHLQFIPIVERRLPDGSDAGPPPLDRRDERPWRLSPDSATGQGWGTFLCDVFDTWIAHDVGRVFFYAVESTLSTMVRGYSGICVHDQTCGRAVVIERDGAVYSCDHYVYPEWRIGDIGAQGFVEMIDSPFQRQFGNDKEDRLPSQCRTCPVLTFCNGGCPKHRFATTADGSPGLNYLCAGYHRYFTHVRAPLQAVAQALTQGKDPRSAAKAWRRRS